MAKKEIPPPSFQLGDFKYLDGFHDFLYVGKDVLLWPVAIDLLNLVSILLDDWHGLGVEVLDPLGHGLIVVVKVAAGQKSGKKKKKIEIPVSISKHFRLELLILKKVVLDLQK